MSAIGAVQEHRPLPPNEVSEVEKEKVSLGRKRQLGKKRKIGWKGGWCSATAHLATDLHQQASTMVR
jgi:hypothetical protein